MIVDSEKSTNCIIAMVDADIRRVRLGEQEVIFPSDKLGKLEDVSHLKGNRDALLKELDKRG